MAEWGYIPYSELRDIQIEIDTELKIVDLQSEEAHAGSITIPLEVEFDLHWRPIPFREIDVGGPE